MRERPRAHGFRASDEAGPVDLIDESRQILLRGQLRCITRDWRCEADRSEKDSCCNPDAGYVRCCPYEAGDQEPATHGPPAVVSRQPAESH